MHSLLKSSGRPRAAAHLGDLFEQGEIEVVRLSLANLATFPWIAAAVAAGRLELGGFRFDIESGVLARVEGNGWSRSAERGSQVPLPPATLSAAGSGRIVRAMPEAAVGICKGGADQAPAERDQGQADLLGRGNAPAAGRAPPPHGRSGDRRRPVHLLPQHQLLRRLPLLRLRPAVRAGGDPGRPDHDLGQHRRRPTLAAHVRRQPGLYRLAAGQLLPRGPGAGPEPRPGRDRARPSDPRAPSEAPGRAAGRPAGRRRGRLHARAHGQVRRGDPPDPGGRPDRRPRRRRLPGGDRGRGRGARGRPARDPGDGARDRRDASRTPS